MILKYLQLVVVVVVNLILIQLFQCSASSYSSSSMEEEEHQLQQQTGSKSNFLIHEMYPILKLLKSDNGFVLNRNITVTQNETQYKIPTIFDEIVFECTSTLPIEWMSSLRWNALQVNKIEIHKKRSMYTIVDGGRPLGQSWFTSKIHFNFKSAENLMNLTCRNLCRLQRNVPHDSCHSTSFVVDDENENDDYDNYFRPYYHASILQGQSLDKPPQKLGGNSKCSYILNMDMENGLYECIRRNGTQDVETGSRVIPCRNPDECKHLHAHDKNCTDQGKKTFNKITNCSSDKCLRFRIPVTPFVVVCGSGTYDTVARNFFQTYRDYSKKGRKLSMYKEKWKILREDKEAIGGARVVQNMMVLRSRTCQQRDESPVTSDNKKILQACQGERVNFICFGQLSVFTPSFLWAVTNDTVNERQDIGHGEEYVDEMNHLLNSTITITMTANMTSVICAAPRWNHLDFENYTVAVNVTKPTRPQFDETVGQTVRVKRGDNHFMCKATSWPPPTYIWKYNLDQKLENTGSWYRVIDNGSQSDLHLNLNSIWNSSFTISCNASNLAYFHVIHFIYTTGESNWEKWGFPAIGVFSLILLILIIILVFALLTIRKQKEKLLSLSEEDVDEFKNGSPDGPEALILPYNMELEIARENIKLGEKILGSGAFGQVTRGKVGIMTVAVKTLKKTADVVYLKALMSEIKVMAFVGRHPHIVNLVGACTENIRKREIFIVLEYCGQGDLHTLLRHCRGIFVNYLEPKAAEYERRSLVEYQNASVKKLSTKDIMRWASEIASGMEWLSGKNVIHGDLAARNILITEDLNAKVGDFGLSKQLFEYSIYVQKLEVPLPLRWMAYESLKDLEFSIQSDIWSFGVVLWEIFTLGETPYPGIDWAFNSWELILSGERMGKPKYATDHMYSLMRSTWDIDPKARPSFQFLKDSIKNHLTSFASPPSRNTLDLTHF